MGEGVVGMWLLIYVAYLDVAVTERTCTTGLCYYARYFWYDNQASFFRSVLLGPRRADHLELVWEDLSFDRGF